MVDSESGAKWGWDSVTWATALVPSRCGRGDIHLFDERVLSCFVCKKRKYMQNTLYNDQDIRDLK